MAKAGHANDAGATRIPRAEETSLTPWIRKWNFKKGFCCCAAPYADVGLHKTLSLIEKLSQSNKHRYSVNHLCAVLDVHRSTFKYWQQRDKRPSPEACVVALPEREPYQTSLRTMSLMTLLWAVTVLESWRKRSACSVVSCRNMRNGKQLRNTLLSRTYSTGSSPLQHQIRSGAAMWALSGQAIAGLIWLW